jgi:hypothetical protein
MNSDFEDDDLDEEISEPCAEGSGVTIEDFVAYMPAHSYFFTPCRDAWSERSVNARLPRQKALGKNGKPKRIKGEPVYISASRWLDQNRPVEQMTWCPGLPMLIPDQLVVDGGWIERKGVTCFNLYRPPRIKPGDASKAGPWLDHVRKIYPDDTDHIINYLAQRVQRPQEKINHALVLGGAQGIGKDTIIEPAKHAVGPWNFHEVSPQQMLGRFNGFIKSVILRVSEARDLGEVNRFSFYEHMKAYTAAPPDVLRVDEKNLREHSVLNACGIVLTTNHSTDGIYLPADDRRHYVAWSTSKKEQFSKEYWQELWGWYYGDGGIEHVAAYLMARDISGFDPKAPPPKTPAFWNIVNANLAPEDDELADVLAALDNPDAITVPQLIAAATGAAAEWLMDRRNRRAMPHRMERCGYVSVHAPYREDGRWVIEGKLLTIYAKATLSGSEQQQAARELQKKSQKSGSSSKSWSDSLQ